MRNPEEFDRMLHLGSQLLGVLQENHEAMKMSGIQAMMIILLENCVHIPDLHDQLMKIYFEYFGVVDPN